MPSQLQQQKTLAATDGTKLFITDWPLAPGTAAHGGIVLMHGISEHSGRYAHIAQFFNACGWTVRTYDHRGHGRSEGKWGDVPHADAIIADAKIVVDDFAKSLPAPPLLFGHSMGGLFAARFAVARLAPLRGLILSSPALAVTLTLRQKLLLKIMRLLAPGFSVSTSMKYGCLSHDPAIAVAYAQDPLIHSVISARLMQSMLAAIDFSQTHAASLAIPTLMLVAGADLVVNAAGSRAFFPQLAPGIGTMHLYEGFYHEVLNEIDAQRAFDDIRAWLALLP